MYNSIALILIIIFIIILLVNQKSYQIENFNNYYKCESKNNGILLKEVLKKYNRVDKDGNWNIYLPCGYNSVESELDKLNPGNGKRIFAIKNCDKIVSKSNLWKILVKNAGYEKAKEIMPETYIYNDTFLRPESVKKYGQKNTDYDTFWNQHAPGNYYVLKKNLQRKEGIKITNDENEIKNGKENGYILIQKYIQNPLLINQHKLNLRVYFLLVIHGDNIYAYVHNLGKCIYTSQPYDKMSLDPNKTITSVNMNQVLYNTMPFTTQNLMVYISEKYGEDVMIDFNKRYVNMLEAFFESIYRELKQPMKFYNNLMFQLFGIDMIFDENLKPFILEINKGPDMIPKSQMDVELKTKIYNDTFDLVSDQPTFNENGYRLIGQRQFSMF
jgi:hypothetical protein